MQIATTILELVTGAVGFSADRAPNALPLVVLVVALLLAALAAGPTSVHDPKGTP